MSKTKRGGDSVSQARRRVFFTQLMQVSDASWQRQLDEKAERASAQGRQDEAIDHARASRRWLRHRGLDEEPEVVKCRLG